MRKIKEKRMQSYVLRARKMVQEGKNKEGAEMLSEGLNYYSKCQKCGKKLTDPESIKRGYGPECWNSLTAHYYRSPVDWENYRVPGQMNIEDFLDMGGGDNGDKKDMP